MRLAKLHISGFKSFPDRAELGFDTGVTAIVGPNGCGKSNVVDAITWVLGEQSAKSLRGERMEDVIFNGSDARKPTATAEVRLKLTAVARAAVPGVAPIDTPAEALLDELPLITRDVEIGRRLYRSGESEYLIDGEVCRLRDVHDLLMDSGLGVKAYAVIEQGKIGQILSSRPAERRSLIEEAAGVTKYKARRRAAELKLEAAQQNLTRVDDIIFEVEKQRGALRRQAARARRYRRLREELRRWEQVHLARRHATLSQDIEGAEGRLADSRAREAAAFARVAELETGLEAVRLDLTQAEAGATDTRESTHSRELEYGRRQQQVQFDRQQIDTLAEQADAYAAEVRDLETRLDPARAAIEFQGGATERLRQTLEDIGARVRAREDDYSRALAAVQGIEQESDSTRAAVLAAAGTLSALRQARDHAAAARDRVAALRERLALEASELSTEVARTQESESQARAALTLGREELSMLVAGRRDAEARLATTRSERERVHLASQERQRQLAALDARLTSLEELEASRATFGDAARLLLADQTAGARRRGALADYLNVERSFEKAVDALLGDLLQHVLVDRADDVTEALSFLSSRDAGRCGFVILDEAAAVAIPETPLVVPPGARSLADVVRTTGPHAAVLSRLLGQALIVDSFRSALAVARTTRVPVATTSGEVVRGGGIVSAGARRDVRGILETRGEIEGLREQISVARREVEALVAREAALDAELASLDAELLRLVERHHVQEKSLVALESEARRAADERARAAKRLALVAGELAQAQEEERSVELRREEAAAAIFAHEAAQLEAESRLGDVAGRLQSSRDEAEGRLRLVGEARAEQAALGERLTVADAEGQRLREAEQDLAARIAQRRQDIERTEVRREELRQAIRTTEAQIDEDVRAIEQLRTGMRSLDERVVALRADFSTAEHQIRSARQALEGVRADVMQAELSRASAASDLAHLEATCLESLGASIDDVVEAVARMEDAGELTAPARRIAAAAAPEEAELDEGGEAGAAPQPSDEAADTGDADRTLSPEEVIAGLKGKIDRLGPVNMMAIEQFDELESRHTFLTSQRKDLLDSIALTGEAIRKIDKTTRERFSEAFHSINAHFETTFTTLFGGGRAGLLLIDQENDQESGIDIIAQPPGKRLQNVQLLSGGEKALTAMALMFAIFKYRPSPFCLLDEIDAPLDDANIGRFVEMLQGMQTHTQFILITHNRKTMEIADRLYGVTMEEPGVSKLISVQLN